MSKRQIKKGGRKSKYDDPIKINASPKAVIQSLFSGKPKPRSQWRYLKNAQPQRSR